jgi:hypothetical protein
MRPTRASAQRRARNSAAMDGRARASSIALKGLLDRQLSSISDTLAKASKRRDEELQQRSATKAKDAQIVQSPTPTNPSLKSDTEGTRSESGDSVNKGPSAEEFAFGGSRVEDPRGRNDVSIQPPVTEVHKTSADTLPGDIPTRGSLSGNYASDDEGPKTLLARFEQGEPSTTTTTETELHRILGLDEIGLEDNKTLDDMMQKMLAEMSQGNGYDGDDVSSMLANADEASTRDEADEDESYDPEQMLSEIGRSESVVGEVAVDDDDVNSILAIRDKGDRSGEDESTELQQMLAAFGQTEPVVNDETVSREDVNSMLAKLEEASSEIEGIRSREAESTELQEMLAEFEHTDAIVGGVTVDGDNGGDMKSMLAEFEARTSFSEGPKSCTSSQYDIDPKTMLAEFEQQTPRLGQEGENQDIEALHGRLTSMLSPGATLRTTTSEHNECDNQESHFDPAIVPYVVAIHLETAGSNWEKARGWTTYLFSSGLDGYEACQEKDRIVSQADEELENIIQQVLEEETVHQTVENKARRPRRLIVSNIAADASDEDLREFFYSFRFAMYVTIIPLIDKPTC